MKATYLMEKKIILFIAIEKLCLKEKLFHLKILISISFYNLCLNFKKFKVQIILLMPCFKSYLENCFVSFSMQVISSKDSWNTKHIYFLNIVLIAYI